MPYYHATHRSKLPSIRKFGLGGIAVAANFEGAVAGGVYLASEPAVSIMMLVEHYAAYGDPQSVPAEEFKEWVVIVIDDHRIDARFLERDPQLPQFEGAYRYAHPLDISGSVLLSADTLMEYLAAESVGSTDRSCD